jgi:hypothetical protein
MELDIQRVCDGIHRLAKRLDLSMGLTPSALYTMLIDYLVIRSTVVHPFVIDGPKRRVSKPSGWTENHEAIWTQWLEHEVPLDSWNELIMEPVFGQDVRLWEINMEGWRDEIYTLMPFWFVRSMTRFEEIDPTMLPDEEEGRRGPSEERKKQELDPYLADYYERR